MATTPEAEALAALLRRLKDRSGLSYGVLAGKLHVSTSTLHRYCNGDAVPADFAPVERLARLCGGQSEELVALHRRWILADEARRRGRAGAEAAPPVVPETVGGVGLEAVPESVGAVGPEAVPETVGAPAGRTPEAGPAEPEPLTVADGSPGAAPVAPATLLRRKSVLVVLAAAAVIAVAVPVAVLANGADDSGGSEAKGKGPAGAAPPAGVGAPSRSASVSVPASASPSPSGSPSTSASRGWSPSAEETEQGKAPAKTGGVPLRVGISSYNWASPCGQYYLLDRKPDGVPPPPAPQDHRRWARPFGGVDAGHMQLQLTATGRTQDSVVINAVHVRTVARNAPLAWDAYSMGEGCGSGVTPQTFDVDLDAGRPVAEPVAGTDGDLTVPAKDFPYKVASNDPQVLNFDVHTEAHDVSWYLEVAWSSGDRHGTVRVDDDGRPFRISAAEGRPMYDYWPDKSEWVAR
ncbi:helix-turn-helix domain-containing protein [Streptomyces sp. NPDC096176]|uniref:helix-turn-helix domain-containing protein n=1 Tax=Streptomyces sp. NPDC096176 TaxID=3366079 RepID=UPI0037F246DC